MGTVKFNLMTPGKKKFVKLVLGKLSFWMVMIICIFLGIGGVLMSDHLQNRMPFTIAFGIAFFIVMARTIAYYIAIKIQHSESLNDLRERRNGIDL
jgi:cytochrome b subunit of formate dehydrogenase